MLTADHGATDPTDTATSAPPALRFPLEDRAARLRRIIDENAMVDLHAHTKHSDGAWAPDELARDGVKEGLALLAVTDHDVVSGCHQFEVAAYRWGLLPVVGCEVTVTLEGKNYHILSYDLDPTLEVWARIRQDVPARRLRYFEEMFGRLRAQGLNVSLELALDESGELVNNATSTALIRGGNCQTEDEARELLKKVTIDYPIHILAVEAATYADWLPRSAAICSVAHAMREEPGTSNRISDRHVAMLKEMLPLVALEAYHPYHKPEEVEATIELARRHRLAITTGSDAHGYHVKRPPRPYPAELSHDFLELLHDRWHRTSDAYLATQAQYI